MLTMARFGSLGGHFLGAVSHDRCFQSNILNIHIFAHFGSVTLINPILCEFSLNRFISSDCLACDWEDIAGQSVLYHDGTTTTPPHRATTRTTFLAAHLPALPFFCSCFGAEESGPPSRVSLPHRIPHEIKLGWGNFWGALNSTLGRRTGAFRPHTAYIGSIAHHATSF